MTKCMKCGVYIADNTDKCPLCQQVVAPGENTGQIYRHDIVPFLRCHVAQQPDMRYAGIVNEHIYMAKMGNGIRNHILGKEKVSYISGVA